VGVHSRLVVLLAVVLALSPWGHVRGLTETLEPASAGGSGSTGEEHEPPESSLRDALPEEERLAEAGASFSRGVEAYKNGRFEEAQEAFARAQRLAPHPDTLFNLGMAQQSTGDHVAAWRSFEQLRAEASTDAEREELLSIQAVSRPHVAQLRVKTEAPGLVCFDGAPMPHDASGEPRVVTTPGRHRVDIDRAHRPVDLDEGEDRVMDVELAAPEAPEMSRRRLRVLGGLSIAGAGAAAGLGLGAGLADPDDMRLGLGIGAAAAGTMALTTTVIALLVHRRARRWTPPPLLERCPP